MKAFLEQPDKPGLPHPQARLTRVLKNGHIRHPRYGSPVQINQDKVPVVVLGAVGVLGNGIRVSALRFVAECVLGFSLKFSNIRVVPADGDEMNTTFANVRFVDARQPERDVDCTNLPTAGQRWFSRLLLTRP